jgi:WD40 repeat protein
VYDRASFLFEGRHGIVIWESKVYPAQYAETNEAISISPNGKYIAMVNSAGVRIFSVENNIEVWQLSNQYYENVILAFSVVISNQDLCAIGSFSEDTMSDGIRLFNWRNNVIIWCYSLPSRFTYLTTLAISPDGEYILAGTNNGIIFLFDQTDNIPIWSWHAPESTQIISATLTQNDNHVLINTGDGICLLSKVDNAILWTFRGGQVYSTAISSAGYIVAATDEGILIFDWQDNLKLRSIPYRASKVAISDDGARIVAAAGHEVYLFNTMDGSTLWNYTYSFPTTLWLDTTQSTLMFMCVASLLSTIAAGSVWKKKTSIVFIILAILFWIVTFVNSQVPPPIY